jgi:hypothetical protein
MYTMPYHHVGSLPEGELIVLLYHCQEVLSPCLALALALDCPDVLRIHYCVYPCVQQSWATIGSADII